VTADAVISTVPTPLVSSLVPDLPVEWKRRYEAIPNIGVICVIFKLRRSVSPHFWVNVSEQDIEIPGVIEFTNLRPLGQDAVVYVPVLHAGDQREIFLAGRTLAEGGVCLSATHQPSHRRERHPGHKGGAASLWAASL
jgi:protoporphyrinogen oxidase